MSDDLMAEQVNELAMEIEASLYRNSGALLFGDAMYSALGFPSAGAFRKALSRNTVPIQTFTISNRRGRFVLSKDVALWLAKQKLIPHVNKRSSYHNLMNKEVSNEE